MSGHHPDHQSIADDAWDNVIGGMNWLKSVIFGEFADYRPLSAVVADMLVSFVPGVVIVTSARDAVAVTLRLASHAEKREDLMEWVLLCACLITIALPLAMAAGGVALAGVGAVVGGIAGTELGAALRAVMLMLIKEASKLVELVQFMQKFIKGDILKFLRAVEFAKYEKPLVLALNKICSKLLEMVKSLRLHLESLTYLSTVKTTVAKLIEWEHKFYAVQHAALTKVPLAMAELDARLAKVLAQTAPKEVHTVAAGVTADKGAATLPAKQAVMDTPGKILAKVDDGAADGMAKAAPKGTSKPGSKGKPKKSPAPQPKPQPDPIKPTSRRMGTKVQDTADALVIADRERIAQLSNEARNAQKSGDAALAEKKIDEARQILKPHFPTKDGDTWDEVIKRLDVSSPKDGAVFWSGTAGQAKDLGQPDAARAFAEKIGGVTLETTSGGRVIDGWPDINNLPWDGSTGASPPFSGPLWEAVSRKYAESTSGVVNVVQTPDRVWSPKTVWHNQEKPLLLDRLETGKIDAIEMHIVDLSSSTHQLSPNYIDQLLKFDQRKP